MKKLKLTLVLFIAITYAYAGGGWPQKKNGYFFKLGQYSIFSSYIFSSSGEVISVRPSAIHLTSLYGEFGITSKLTAIAHVPFFARATAEEFDILGITLPAESANTMGDVDLALKYTFLQKDGWASAVQLTVGLPLGDPNAGSGILQTGDGEFNQMVEVHASKGLNNGYFSLTGGFNNRDTGNKGFSDEIRYGLEGGVKWKSFYGIMRLYGVKPINNGDNPEIIYNSIFNNRTEFLGISPEIVYEMKENFGITVGAGFAAYGKRIMAAPSLSVGVYLKSI